jgi:hypothetical protein
MKSNHLLLILTVYKFINKDDNNQSNHNENNNLLKSIDDHHDRLAIQTKNLDKLKVKFTLFQMQVQNIVLDEDTRGDYENFLKLPEIKNPTLTQDKLSLSESLRKDGKSILN